MLGILIVIVILFLLFNPGVLPKLGTSLGSRSRKPFQQAKWMWSSFTGTEEDCIRAEQDYGRECARAFATQFPGKIKSSDQELVESIGAKLAKAVNDPRRQFRFMVIDSPTANAYALPGGFIFITGALLDRCGHDHSETAFFLAHEIGHVLRGHARDQMTANTFLNAIGSRLPAAGQMLRHVVSKGYSRMQELEADQEAVRLSAVAGFVSGASISALQRLAEVARDPSGLAEYLSSHPPISERIRELEKTNHIA